MTDGAIVRLNARIHNQREQIKHDKFVLEQVSSRAYRLVTLLGINAAQPLVMALDDAIAAIVDTHRMAETENTGSVRSMSGDGAGTAIAQPSDATLTKGEGDKT